MSKINDRYYFETDDFFNTNGIKTEKTNQGVTPTAFQHFKLPLGTDKHSLSRIEIFQNKQTFCKKPTPMHTTQYLDLNINYQRRFNMQTENKTPTVMLEQNEQISQESMSSKLVFNTFAE